MPLNLLIFMKTAIGYKNINNKTFNDGESTYGLRKTEKPGKNMSWTFYLICLALITTPVYADGDYFPGMRFFHIFHLPYWRKNIIQSNMSILISYVVLFIKRLFYFKHIENFPRGWFIGILYFDIFISRPLNNHIITMYDILENYSFQTIFHCFFKMVKYRFSILNIGIQ